MPWIIGAVVALAVLIVAGVVILASRSSTHASPTSSPHVSHLAVLDATPTNAATVDSTASIRVALNAPLAANSPLPTLSPAVAGHWERLSPSVLTFVQSNPLSPGQKSPKFAKLSKLLPLRFWESPTCTSWATKTAN